MISLKWCNDGVKPSFQPSRECRWWHYYFATSSKFHIYKVKQTTCCNSKQKFTYVYHWSTINIPKKLFIFTTMEICSTWGLDCFFKLKNRVCCGLLSALYFGPKVVCWWMTGISLLSVNNWDQGRTSVVISFSYSWSMTQSYCLLYFFLRILRFLLILFVAWTLHQLFLDGDRYALLVFYMAECVLLLVFSVGLKQECFLGIQASCQYYCVLIALFYRNSGAWRSYVTLNSLWMLLNPLITMTIFCLLTKTCIPYSCDFGVTAKL